MASADFEIGRKGLRMEAPAAGDIVTVKVKRRPRRDTSTFGGLSLIEGDTDEADNPQHYRMTAIWRVVAVNGGQAVVEGVEGYSKGRREVWPVSLHEWFEASELYEALYGTGQPD